MAQLTPNSRRIPRPFRIGAASSRRSPAHTGGAYLRALSARLGPLPRHVATWARLAARQAVDLEALDVELDAARVAGRRKQAAGLRHRISRGTARLLALETRIERLVRPDAPPAQTDAEVLAAVRRLRGEEAQ